MPVSTTVDAGKKLIINIGFGSVAEEDFLQARKELLADPKFDSSFDRIWDFTGVTEENLAEGVIARLVATTPSGDHIYRAVVCSAAGTINRVLEFIAHSRNFNRQIAVFPTFEQAEAWIQSQHVSHTD